ncbi:L10-interacting MYB domain-containing protein isoform X1 [Lactuca sativa]|uniref:Myb/SANT-like domain-containing protein n=1 Tax=Lactuca sativa TaxID=4236 RepID=A0A9R1UIW5_LACSA|nr:L10-interacting MYB domain-containing protein isoform X1 [Lactuca sativa]KAJ0188086.1 hypothetical protein LSAT_V11C900466290 [Lactuca sativa]
MGRVPVDRQSGLQQKSPSAELPLTEASPSSTSPHISFESSPATRSSTTPCSDQSNKKNRAVILPLSLGVAQRKPPRINWKQENIEKTFLEACLHEITVNGREGNSLKVNSWKNVGQRLQKEHDFDANQRQMKNRYDYLKAKFGAWLKLRNKSGNVYDPIKNKFNLEEEEWQMEIKSNKYVQTLRTAPLLFPDLCIQLFEGVTSNGFDGCGPSSQLPHDMDSPQSQQQPSTPRVLTHAQQPPTPSDESSCRSKKRKSKDSLELKILEIGEEICKVARLLMKNHTIDDDVDACIEKLEKFEWGTEDPRYNTALMLFGESEGLRKVWLRIKPASCENWIRNAGRKYGLL